MTYLPVFAWYLILLPTFLLAARKSSIDIPLGILIFLVISGRTPYPFEEDVELWMLFALYFPFVAWNHIRRPSYRNHIFRYRSPEDPLYLIFVALLIFIGVLSSFFLPAYNDGYLLLLIEISSLVAYVILNESGKILRTIAVSIGMSAFLMIQLGLFVQLFIFFGLADCHLFFIYHPQGDIHCLSSSVFSIYRFSIGSNINEFSFYILLLALLLFSKNRAAVIGCIQNVNIFSAAKLPPSLSIYLPTLIASFLSLSRALWLALLLYFIGRLSVTLSLQISRGMLALSGLWMVRSLMFLAFLAGIVLVCYIYFFDVYLEIFALLYSRGSFAVDPTQIFEGSSSGARLDALSSASDSNIFSLFPLHALGSGTYLHNTFLQFIIEYGSIAAALGILVITIAVKRASLFIAPILVFMSVHHVLYNPTTWLSLFYFSRFLSGTSSGSILVRESGIVGDAVSLERKHS